MAARETERERKINQKPGSAARDQPCPHPSSLGTFCPLVCLGAHSVPFIWLSPYSVWLTSTVQCLEYQCQVFQKDPQSLPNTLKDRVTMPTPPWSFWAWNRNKNKKWIWNQEDIASSPSLFLLTALFPLFHSKLMPAWRIKEEKGAHWYVWRGLCSGWWPETLQWNAGAVFNVHAQTACALCILTRVHVCDTRVFSGWNTFSLISHQATGLWLWGRTGCREGWEPRTELLIFPVLCYS